jgi:hypothetical protein
MSEQCCSRQDAGTRSAFFRGVVTSLAALALGLLSTAPSALAGPPLHPPLPDPIGGFSLNHACGTAVDSKGDIYVSNAGEGKVEVFDSSGTHLKSISNANEPCGLAVDSKGNLYVSEQATENVVRFTPDSYPLSGSPIYSPAQSIDESGDAKGISVDTTDDSLYVAEGNRIAMFGSEGTPGINESQRLHVFGTGGAYKLSFKGQATASLPREASHGEVQAALESLSTIGPGNVAVSQASGGNEPTNHQITFRGALGGVNEPKVILVSSLTPNQLDSLTIDASGGTYTLTLPVGAGEGTLTSGSDQVSDLVSTFGSFHAGDAIASGGLPAGTTIVEVGSETLKLSQNATESHAEASFRDEETTTPIAFDASAATVQAALEALAGVAPGDVVVSGGPGGPGGLTPYSVAFQGAYAGGVVALSRDQSALSGTATVAVTTFGADFFDFTLEQGFDGHIGEGELSSATGVAAYTYNGWHYLSAAEPAQDEVEILAGSNLRSLKAHAPIDGSETPAGDLGLAASGAYLGIDSTNGHFYVYNANDEVLNEFEASGHYVTQVASPAFTDAKATSIAVDRSQGSNDGDLYVTAGAAAGAKLLAFEPVQPPTRAEFGEPSSHKTFPAACGTVVDSAGNLYVAGEAVIRIFDPAGHELTHIDDATGRPCDLAVDSEGNLYAVEKISGTSGEQIVAHYKPQAFPPTDGTSYTKGPLVEVKNAGEGGEIRAIAVNIANDHLLVSHFGYPGGIVEYDSFPHGSALLRQKLCGGAGTASEITGLDVNGSDGDVYFFETDHVTICDNAGHVLTRIDGSGSPLGSFGHQFGVRIAVDQSNGHLIVGSMLFRGDVEEYEPSGAFVGQFGTFQQLPSGLSDIAIDNSGGSSDGRLYAAYDAPTGLDVTTLGPLAYGEPPVVAANPASGITGGQATLNGTVAPRGVQLEDCHFEYLTDAVYLENIEAAEEEGHEEAAAEGFGFSAAPSKACAESPAAIGSGLGAVPVHAQIENLDPEGRYRYRLLAKSKYGTASDVGLFGPPVIVTKTAQPVSYREATLRAKLDPSGLQTTYHFEYGTSPAYDQSTSPVTLQADAGPTDVEGFPTGLAEGTNYHFRLVAENEEAAVKGSDQGFETLAKLKSPPCPNETLRLENNSSGLPDCRAYELVTPADTRGAQPSAFQGSAFSNWLVTPAGPLEGQSLAYFIHPSGLPGFDGSGITDAFRATRGSAGWSSDIFSPTYVQKGAEGVEGEHSNEEGQDAQEGVSSDQLYSFWKLGGSTPGALPFGDYLRTPPGSPQPAAHCAVEAEPQGRFEWLGCGSLGIDPQAQGQYISPGGDHVIFETANPSAVRLEPAAPPSPLGAVYDRSPGSVTHVVSLLPGDVTPTSSATYMGASADGSSVAFSVADSLYLRVDGAQTIEVADGPFTFAGVAADGSHVFYADSVSVKGHAQAAAGLYVFDVDSQVATEIAPDSVFVNVSADGSHVYFTSEEILTGSETNQAGDEAQAGAHNLYTWSATGTRFIAALVSDDLVGGEFPGTTQGKSIGLDNWTGACVGGFPGRAFSGGANCPSRTSPEGRYLAFQSHADLALPYEGEGHSTIYLYDAEQGNLICVSCDPSGAPATGEADFQSYSGLTPAQAATIIPGVTEDGNRVFFQASSALLPEDANSVLDVYEWTTNGVGGCAQAKGCLSLISSGQSSSPSFIYSMTPDGHDVFFSTVEKLIGADIVGSSSIYDARVGGGFPRGQESEPCHGDACQGEGSPSPDRPLITSSVSSAGNPEPSKTRCPKGKSRVRKGGKNRCVKGHSRKHQKHHGTDHDGRASR